MHKSHEIHEVDFWDWHLSQRHLVFLTESIFDTTTHESVWYHSLHVVHSIKVESVRSGILHMQYTGINSVHFIGSVSCLAPLPGNICIVCFSKHFFKFFLILFWLKKNASGCSPNINAVANAMLNNPQSAPPDCSWSFLYGSIICELFVNTKHAICILSVDDDEVYLLSKTSTTPSGRPNVETTHQWSQYH